MALWTPPSNVGPNEHIGRRLFERRKLRGAEDQRSLLKGFEIYHFEETRGKGEVSLDRLGQSSVDRRVRNYLELRAAAASSKIAAATPFIGWLVVRASDLQKPSQGPAVPPIASPEATIAGDELSENKYHAHVERPTNYTAYEMAMHLRQIFHRKLQFEAVRQEQAPLRGWRWLCSLLARTLPH